MADIKSIVTGIQHIGLPTADIEKTIEFYAKFGFEVEFRTVLDGKTPVAFLRNGSCVMETYQEGVPAMCAGAIDHISLDVNDIEAAYAYAKEQGYEAIQGGITFLPFYENGVKFFTILGPNEEKVEFNQKL